LAVVNYFVELTMGFGLFLSDAAAATEVYMIKREGDKLTLDKSFIDENDHEPGINFNRDRWPHGETGHAKPHGVIFVD
jgi:hypothetical protein